MTELLRADLHTHTIYSDGALSPPKLLQRAHQAGLTHVAICDHDTIAAYSALVAADVPAGMTVVPGVEISAWFGVDVHILALGVDRFHPRLRRTIANLIRHRADRLGAIIDKLFALGCFAQLSADDKAQLRHRLTTRSDLPTQREVEVLEEEAATGDNGNAESASMVVVGPSACRLNLVQEMIAHGVVQNVQEAFARYLGDRGPAFVPYARYDGAEAVEMIREAGGVPILAHPKIYRGQWERAIRDAAKAGIMGIELYHPKQDAAARADLVRVVSELQLPFVTGGSDFHGDDSRFAPLFGSMHTPPETLPELFAAMACPSVFATPTSASHPATATATASASESASNSNLR